MTKPKGVGVRELRQNLSKYLRRVARGESFRVSDRGRPVAILAPLPEQASSLERLMAEGRVLPARMNLAALGKPSGEALVEIPISRALADQRAEE